jgi:hypothetical protein
VVVLQAFGDVLGGEVCGEQWYGDRARDAGWQVVVPADLQGLPVVAGLLAGDVVAWPSAL